MIKVVTYNIHKGYSQFNTRFVLHELRERLHDINADIVFLQEVRGADRRSQSRHHFDGAHPQHEFLAGESWLHHAYGKNSVYESGHHGNAILSRYPIVKWDNQDISAHRFESRGLLHCELQIPGNSHALHCLCVHLGLFSRGRIQQMEELVKRVNAIVPDDAPMIIAGDFNDWRNQSGQTLSRELNIQDVFHTAHGISARSFPSRMPLFRLDRIYVRGFDVLHCNVHTGGNWLRLSDHAALSAQLKSL